MTKKRSFVLITLLAAMSCLNANEFESNEAITKLNKATSLLIQEHINLKQSLANLKKEVDILKLERTNLKPSETISKEEVIKESVITSQTIKEEKLNYTNKTIAGRVIVDKLNLRDAPNKKGKILKVLNKGVFVIIAEKVVNENNHGWLKLLNGGYVFMEHIKIIEDKNFLKD